MLDSLSPSTLDSTAHIIQVALTPVFLLSGLATLLNVFATRLGRVADQFDALTNRIVSVEDGERAHIEQRIARLRVRSLLLDLAVLLGAAGGVAICGAVLTLLVGALRDATVASLLFALFGAAILCTICALVAFGVEMLIASKGVRLQMAAEEAKAGTGGDARD